MSFLGKCVPTARGFDEELGCFCKKVSYQKFGQLYLLGNVLGEGGFGRVLQATHISDGAQVAVKIIKKRLPYRPRFLARLQAEINTLRKIKHANIIRLHNVLHDEENIYIVTDLCVDGDVFDWLKNRKNASELDILRIMKQALEGLAYMHKKGIVHRDIKPENIALSRDKVKLIDFGLSAEVREGEMFTDDPGSDGYQSPEMLRRIAYCPRAADMWALGVTFYEMLTGDRRSEVMDMRRMEGVSEETVQLVELMLRNNQWKRFPAENALIVIKRVIKSLEKSI